MRIRRREKGTTRMRRSLVLLAAMALTLGMLAPAGASDRGAQTEVADVIGQGPEGPTVAENGATLRRTDNGIQVRLQMPTPEPGSYAYPEEDDTAASEGHPEGFTLWVFVVEDGDIVGGFFGAGHMVGGDRLTLSGRIDTGSEPVAGEPLENPREVDIHLAVAPHGGLDPDIMPEQIQTPAGGPGMWWFAIFDD